MGRRIPLIDLFFIVGVSIILTACRGSSPATNLPGSPIPEREVALSVTPTPTMIAPTLSQAQIPTPETSVGLLMIEPGNAGQVVELAKLGKGTILSDSISTPRGIPVYSPDGLLLAIPTSAGIYVYDAVTLEELHRIPAGSSSIFSPAGNLLAAGGYGIISLWDPITGELVAELSGDPADYYRVLAFSPGGSLLAVESWNAEIIVWSLEGSGKLFTFPGDVLQFSPDGELAVVVQYGENRVHLYETRSGGEVNKWNVRHAGFTPGGQLWLEDDESVRLVYIDRDQATAPFRGVQPSFSADGTLMALVADSQISIYDHQKGQRVQVLEGYYPQIDGVLFSPDGQTLAGEVNTLHCPTCTEMDGLDSYLVLWRSTDGSIITKMKTQGRSALLGYSLDGSQLATVLMGDVQIINTTDGSLMNQIGGFTAPIEGMVLSPDGKSLIAGYGTQPYTLRVWDLEEGQVARLLQDRPEGGALSNHQIAFSPDQELFAVGGDLWEIATGERLSEVERAITEVTSCWSTGVAFSPQGDTLATGCFDGQLDLWRLPDGALVKRIGGYSSWVDELAYSPDGEYLAAIYDVPDYLVQVWQLPQGKPAIRLHGGHFTRVAYSPDGETLATVMANQEYDQYGWPAGFVQLWSASDGKELSRLEAEDAVSIAFSPDGRILATGSLDGTLRLWEMPAGRLLMEAREHYERIQGLAFTPDGTSLVSASQDGTILRWGILDSSLP